MAPEAAEPGELRRRRVTRPRPGHADLVGVLKYDRVDARDILERASARETTARVAAGALARRLLDEFGVEIGSHVVSLGGVIAAPPSELPVPLNGAADRSEIRVLDPAVEAEIIRRIDAAKKAGDTLGGEVEVVARGRGRGPRQPRGVGPEARRTPGGRAHVDPGGQGRRDRPRRRGGAAARLRGARSHRCRLERSAAVRRRSARRLPPPQQQRRRSGGRHHHRRAARDPGRHEADQHPDVAAAHRGPRHGSGRPTRRASART